MPKSRASVVLAQLGYRVLLSFALGQMSRSLIWCIADLLIGFHLTVHLGLTGRTAGTILFGSFAFGAVLNLLAATWLARRVNARTDALRFQALFGIASVVAALILFGPVSASGTSRIVYICVSSAFFRLAYTLFDVCQNALISLLPRRGSHVRDYVLTKTFVSSIGRLLASGLVFVALRAPVGTDADFKMIGLVAIPVILSVLILARVTPTTDERIDVDAARFTWASLPIRRLALPVSGIVLQVGLLGLVGRLIPLFGAAKPGFADGSSLVVAMVCGTIVGPIVGHAGTRTPSRSLFVGSILTICTTGAASGLLFPHALWAGLALAFLYGAALTGITNIIWEQVAAIVTDVAAATSVRIDIPAFALLTAGINVAIAISNGVLALVLDGFKRGEPSSLATIVAVLVLGGMGTALILAVATRQDASARGRFHVAWPRRAPRLSPGVGR